MERGDDTPPDLSIYLPSLRPRSRRGRSARQQSRRMQSLADAVMGGVNAGLVHAAKADPDALRRAACEDAECGWRAGQ